MAIKTNKAIKISQKHLLGIQDLSVNDINYILDESEAFIKLKIYSLSHQLELKAHLNLLEKDLVRMLCQ